MRKGILAALLVTIAAASTVLTAGDRDAYIYKRGDTVHMRTTKGAPEYKELTRRYGNEFVWTEHKGQKYVITDPGVLAELRVKFAEFDHAAKPLHDLEERMRPHEHEIDAISDHIDEVGDRFDDTLSDAERERLEEKLRRHEKALQAAEARMAVVEREMERAERELERLEEIVERDFDRIVARAIRDGKAKRVD
jgi:dephospho-CoA kinase